MSTLARCIPPVLTLCLLLAPATLPAAHMTQTHELNAPADKPKPQQRGSTERSLHLSCNLTGNCANRPADTICRSDGRCIPASPAWSSNGPLVTKSQKPGGFEGLNSPPPLPVPLPMPGLLLISALAVLRVLIRRNAPFPAK